MEKGRVLVSNEERRAAIATDKKTKKHVERRTGE
jgi:hypothetical protein